MADHFYYPFEKDGRLNSDRSSYQNLTEYEKYQLSFHPERPKYLDFLSLFDSVSECLASDEFGACLIQTHRAVLDADGLNLPVMLIGQQTGPTSNYSELIQSMADPEIVRKWNHGMPTPASYQRASQAIRLASEEGRQIIVFVDTPGADPTEASEAGGIAWRIGETIQALVEAKVPTLAVILNRACSGGAIALTGCDRVLALEYSTYLVITPEACSSILFHTRSRADEAAAVSRITSREGLEYGIVDALIPEGKGPAHRNPEETRTNVLKALIQHCSELNQLNPASLWEQRITRWKNMGHWEETKEHDVWEIQRPVSRLPKPNKEGFIKRHSDCRDSFGRRIYDPVDFIGLRRNNYVCSVCGYRYVRPSIWDYMDLILDPRSFKEHKFTRRIVDKDILNFPGYATKLEETRKTTGLMSAMITGNARIEGHPVVFCGVDFGFLGGSFCMSTGEKIWRASEVAIKKQLPMVLIASGGGARMHEGCSSMVAIPKAHLALTRVEQAHLPVITLITDPTLGGVAIGYGSRGTRLFELNAGNIGFSGKRVIEQYTGQKTSPNFQRTDWLKKHGHVEHMTSPETIRDDIAGIIESWEQRHPRSPFQRIMQKLE